MKHKKELAILLAIGIVVSGLVTAAAAEAGSPDDPFIALNWLKSTFLPGAKEDLDDHVNNRFDDLGEELLNAGTEGQELRVKRGDVLRLESGSSLTPLAGGFAASAAGTILDVTEGSELPISGGSIQTNHRYLAAEDTKAAFSVTSDTAVVRLTGLYQLNPSRETDYNALADALHVMGLFSGSDTPYGSSYDLEKGPTRVEGLIMFLRLLGKESAAKEFVDETVTFADVPAWALPYVSYAYHEGFTAGQKVNEQGEVVFGSNDKLASRDYVTFLLRALGYKDFEDFSWKTAVADAQALGILTAGEGVLLTEKPFLRAQVVYLSYFALSSNTTDGVPLREQLAASGALDGAVISEMMKNVGVERL